MKRTVSLSLAKGFCLIALMAVLSLLLGRYKIPFSSLGGILLSPGEALPAARIVFYHVRLPRVLAALFVGAALSGAGVLFQTVFKNPMVSPSVMGASSGAAFGAALAILLELTRPMIQAGSFLMGTMAVFAAVTVASFSGRRSRILMLVLSGMLVSTFFTALTSLVKYTADPQNTLPAITYWLMGSLSGSEMGSVLFTAIVVIFTSIVLYSIRWKITALSLDDEELKTMGMNPVPYRYVAIVCAALMTSAAVSLGGVIGWVGLVVPHLAKMITGARRFEDIFLHSLFLGAAYLLCIDTIFRVITPLEIPLGILTALIGAPFFACVILRSRRGAQ